MKNERLLAVLQMLEPCEVLADVGCDHAYLACECIRQKKAQKCYAGDIGEGPLVQARKTIEREGLEGVVIPVLSNGLQKIPADTQSVVIAGMGYETVKMILEQDFDKVQNYRQILIQVNKDVPLMRKWISDRHFTITDERLVLDRRPYAIISFSPNYHEAYSEIEIFLGPCFIKERSFEWLGWLQKEQAKLKRVVAQIPSSDPKAKQFQRQIQMMEDVLSGMD